MCFPDRAVVENPLASAGDATDVGSIPGPGKSSGVGNGNPLQNSCLEKSHKSLASYSPVLGESDMSECTQRETDRQTDTHTHTVPVASVI